MYLKLNKKHPHQRSLANLHSDCLLPFTFYNLILPWTPGWSEPADQPGAGVWPHNIITLLLPGLSGRRALIRSVMVCYQNIGGGMSNDGQCSEMGTLRQFQQYIYLSISRVIADEYIHLYKLDASALLSKGI